MPGRLEEQADAGRPLAPGGAGLPRLEPAVVRTNADGEEDEQQVDRGAAGREPDALQYRDRDHVDQVSADALQPVRVVAGRAVTRRASVALRGSIPPGCGHVPVARVSVARGSGREGARRACVAYVRATIAARRWS